MPSVPQHYVTQFRMAKRNLRVTKWIRTMPAVAVCTACNREFKVPPAAMKRVSDAQRTLKDAFAEHECDGENAVRTLHEDLVESSIAVSLPIGKLEQQQLPEFQGEGKTEPGLFTLRYTVVRPAKAAPNG